MSKYSYFSWHDIKDLALIYNDDEWDNAHINVWDPENQRSFDISFTGSSKSEGSTPNNINFNINKKDITDITDDEKSIDEYFKTELSYLYNDKERDLYKMIFKRGVELGRNLSTK